MDDMGTKHQEGRLARASGESGRRGASGVGTAGIAGIAGMVAGIAGMVAGIVAVLLLLGLAGCASGAVVTGPTPAPTIGQNSGTPTAHATLTLPTVTSAASPGGTTGQQGAKEFCSKSPDVTIHPDSNVPVYPGATLRFSQANGSNAFFGFCTNDSTSAVHDFYSVQLSKSGWSGLQTSTIATVVQISATQCAGQNAPQIIVTIAPDTTGATTTSISIVVLAGSC